MKKITILSGKGGVGKSSITASLAFTLSKNHNIICADCDVDASNLALVLGANKHEEWIALSTNKKAVFDYDKCISCKKCMNECYFNAIAWKDNKPLLKEFSCEGCGLCELLCPEQAIKLERYENAHIGFSNSKYGFKVVSAQLGIGESGSGKVVSEVRKKAEELADGAEIMLIDASAGIGCPVIASIAGTDYAIIVTEPSPAGFSDMKKAIQVVSHFKIPCSIIINKFNLNKDYTAQITDYAKENNLKILSMIGFDQKFAKALTAMIPIVEFDKNYFSLFNDIKNKLLKEV